MHCMVRGILGINDGFISVSNRVNARRASNGEKTYQDDTIEPLLEPCHRILLFDTVLEANACLLLPPPGDASTRTAHHNVKVHAKDTNAGVVPRTEIDVLLDTKAKVARLGEVAAAEFVLLDLETTLEDLLRLRPTNGDVHCDFLVTANTERPDGVAGF